MPLVEGAKDLIQLLLNIENTLVIMKQIIPESILNIGVIIIFLAIVGLIVGFTVIFLMERFYKMKQERAKADILKNLAKQIPTEKQFKFQIDGIIYENK